jgi:hypothetical protein
MPNSGAEILQEDEWNGDILRAVNGAASLHGNTG